MFKNFQELKIYLNLDVNLIEVMNFN